MADQVKVPDAIANGCTWKIDMGRVKNVSLFQDDDTGRPKAYLKLEWFGGIKNIEIDPDYAGVYEDYKGKWVTCHGPLQLEQKQKGMIAVLSLSEITLL